MMLKSGRKPLVSQSCQPQTNNFHIYEHFLSISFGYWTHITRQEARMGGSDIFLFFCSCSKTSTSKYFVVQVISSQTRIPTN